MSYVSIGAKNPVTRDGIDVRCRVVRATIERYVAVTEIVRKNDNDIWGQCLRRHRALLIIDRLHLSAYSGVY